MSLNLKKCENMSVLSYNSEYMEAEPTFPRTFYCFVSITLSILLILNCYAYFGGHSLNENVEGSFTDIKYVVKQLMHGLKEVNNKHERLQTEIDRISSTLPVMAASASRAKNILEPTLQESTSHIMGVHDYDQHITDYALESAGGKILDTGDTIDYVLTESPFGYVLYVLSSMMCKSCIGARAMLQPGSLPGECWAFTGSKGEATIRLLRSIYVTGVSLEHIPPHISPTKEISSAPRMFQIEGLHSTNDQHPHDFGTYEYNKHGKQIQYFEILKQSHKPYLLMRLRILSNWGHPVYTCVYRFRVHGELADRASTRPIGQDENQRLNIGL